jgi:hypothetical protein
MCYFLCCVKRLLAADILVDKGILPSMKELSNLRGSKEPSKGFTPLHVNYMKPLVYVSVTLVAIGHNFCLPMGRDD